MNRELLEKLMIWRNNQALSQGVENYRVLSNEIIKEIVLAKPKSKEELTSIKGIKEKKFESYGQEILSIVNGDLANGSSSLNQKTDLDKPYSISAYLNLLNSELRNNQARIQGEISSLDIRGSYIFFSLKDKEDSSLLNCFMWMSNYQISGVKLEEGMEIVAEGFPEIYKPSGRLTFRASSVELVGEGSLKKAYEELKKKLEKEGLFLSERKKPVPDFPKRIGIITSKDGAAIGDFLANIGKFGFKISLLDSRVEGQRAASEILKSLQTFRKKHKEFDVLVIMRGGGSLESLLPFNNEMIVREIADFPLPIIAGIGHEKDISLAALASDKMFSTPTAAAKTLNESWEKAVYKIEHDQKTIFGIFEKSIYQKQLRISESLELMKERFRFIFEKFRHAEDSLKHSFGRLEKKISETNRNLVEYLNALTSNFKAQIKEIGQWVQSSEKLLQTHSPKRQLKLGYSIVRKGSIVIRSVEQIKKDDEVNVQVRDGKFKSKIIKISNR